MSPWMAATISFTPPSDDGELSSTSTRQRLRFRVARVHAEKLGGKQRRFVAAGAGADFQDDVLVVVGVARQQQALQFVLDFFAALVELALFVVRQLLDFGVFAFHEHLLGARAGPFRSLSTRGISRPPAARSACVRASFW